MKYIYIIAFFLLSTCVKKEFTAQQIIDKSIENSGVNQVANALISFDFRDNSYSAKRKNGLYTLTRTKDSVADILTNGNFTRIINKKKIELSDSVANLYANSVNSVHYFSVLPFGLNDKAVRKKSLPSVTINGQQYYKIKVTFLENGGGEDFEDVFIYWFNKETFFLEFIAYSYKTNGGGMRFREVKEQFTKEGIRFTNYNNYKPKDKSIHLINIDKAFENNQLEKVSEIVLKNIKVNFL